MIRINLLTVERAKRKPAFQIGQKITLVCLLILVVAGLLVGWRFMVLRDQSQQLDAEVAAAQRETTRLHSIIQQVQQFEQRRAQLQQRVTLIEQLRKGQTGPVHMLDQISRALPPMLWLTELKQTDTDVLIDGRCTAMTSLSDFVANLEASGYFKKSIEIVSSQTEATSQPAVELVKFSIRAQFQPPAPPVPAAPSPAKPKG
jgi:type IV pilus assembly protein PilN